MTMGPKVLTIAGFDGSGGAGIQADIKTFSAFGCYGMTVLTVLPIQNTCGVKNCYEIPLPCIQEQLVAIFEDIRPDAIKIGMLYSTSIIECIYSFLMTHGAGIPIVLDPVMLSKNGTSLLTPEAILSMKEKLIPITTILTPNIPEAHALGAGLATSRDTMFTVGLNLIKLGSKAILLKGGHLDSDQSSDLYVDSQGNPHWIDSNRILTANTHGTGCTLSAAISCCLALGYSPLGACQIAKQYVLGTIKGAQYWTMGKGNGPLDHGWTIQPFTKYNVLL